MGFDDKGQVMAFDDDFAVALDRGLVEIGPMGFDGGFGKLEFMYANFWILVWVARTSE